MLKTWHELDLTDPISKLALEKGLELFPYDYTDDLNDDFQSTKRLIFVNGFLAGIIMYEEEASKPITIKTKFQN